MTIKNKVVGYKVDWNNERHKKLMQVICLESALKIHKKKTIDFWETSIVALVTLLSTLIMILLGTSL